MIGYKGVILKCGVLRSKYGDIFELGVPREEQEVDDGIGFTEAGYSFCGSIEEVIYHENFVNTEKQRIYRDVRLFEIDTMNGIIYGDSYHYKTSNIKLVREITQKEIIEYLSNKKEAKSKVIDEVGQEIFNAYLNEDISPYQLLLNVSELDDLYVRSCMRLGQKDLCKQDLNRKLESKTCGKCNGLSWPGDLHSNELSYLYLLARKKILDGANIASVDEYEKLKSMNGKKECASLQRLL